MTATVFYGGSFDPPHTGHLGMALGVLKSGRSDRVLFAPAYAPPHKTGCARAPFADRMAMVKLLIGDRPGLEACDIEQRLALTPSYTVDVLAALQRERPGERIQLLIGADSLAALHGWGRASELVEKYEVLTYPRKGIMVDEAALLRNWPPEAAQKLLAGLLPGAFFEISSTGIRKNVAKRREVRHINSGTTEPVEEYIRKHHLYQTENQGMTDQKKMNSSELADFCIAQLEEKQAENAIKISIGATSSVGDYFVIGTANSEPQLRALAGFLERELRDKCQLRPYTEAGGSDSGWMLLDYGSVIVHVMTSEVRDRYNLEGLWGETPAEDAVRALTENQP